MALLSATAAAGTVDDGRTAYMRGEYARAFEILKPLADKGDPNAAYIVGRQYQLGQGVARDLGEAWYWYRRAEAKGHVEAGLFRHLLITKWKITEADRARGEARFAALDRTRPPVVARIRMRPSPKPTPALAPPASTPNTVTASKPPGIEVRPTPLPADKKTPAPVATPGKEPGVATRPETCVWCRTDTDTEPTLNDDKRQTATRRPQVLRGDDRAEGPAGEDAARRSQTRNRWVNDGNEALVAPPPRAPTWQEERLYAPPPPPSTAVYPAYRYWRPYPAPVWRRPGWRTRSRWVRPGFARRWRYRGWRY